MSLFRRIFGGSNPNPVEEKGKEYNPFLPELVMDIDEEFITNFKKNGGKFLFCENKTELKEQFENILEENDWFENEVLCYEPSLFELLDENKLSYSNPKNTSFFLAGCENLIAKEGSILFSSNQIKQLKPHELPTNIIIIARINQIIGVKSDGLSAIKNKYERDYPTNITTIKYFEKAQEEDFTQYGTAAKNLYLLLLEDF